MTGDDLIKAALAKNGVVPIGEVAALTTEFKALGLTELNSMLQDWAAEGMLLHAMTVLSVTLVNGTASYTIGASGAFNVRRPVELVEAQLTVSTGVFRPLKVFNAPFRYRGYGSYPVGVPEEVYYNPAFTLGTLTFKPTPDAAYAVSLSTLTSIVSLADSTETITLPPEYENILGVNLAVRLMPSFGKTNQLLIDQAKEGKATLFTNNSKRLIRDSVPLDSMLSGGQVWDINTGWS